MAAGDGGTLGESLADLFASQGRPGGHRSTYTAKGWHAQIAKLTGTRAGRDAADHVGLSPSARTLRAWLSEDQEPSKANQAKIHDAYQIAAGGFAGQWRQAQFEINGRVTMGRDSRVRGQGSAPLRVDGRAGNWDRIEAEWEGEGRPEVLERMFIEDVLVEDLGEGSEPWEFDGSSYRVTA